MRKVFILFLFLVTLHSYAQKAYSKGDMVMDAPVQKILNYSNGNITHFDLLKKDLTIIDFFGTWCAPCIRALPNLSALQKQYPDKLSIVLISTEEQKQLENFIKAHSPFLFPVVIDKDGSYTKRFQPPSYPYTVVIDSQGELLALTEAAAITANKIDEWLAKKVKKPEHKADPPVTIQIKDSVQEIPIKQAIIQQAIKIENTNPLINLSRHFVYAAKTGAETGSLLIQIANLDFDSLVTGLGSDREKKTFWINLYNGFTQVRLKKDPEKYKSRGAFFSEKAMTIANKKFSLDDMEHGILRHSKIKWSLGYLNKWFPNKTEKALRVDKLDYRIHFSLNCGAKSCPPIASYESDAIDKQLDLATKAYLTGEMIYDSVKNTVKLPALMGWFRRDFGGKNQMGELLKKLSLIPNDKNPSISFGKYDWTLYLDNYKK